MNYTKEQIAELSVEAAEARVAELLKEYNFDKPADLKKHWHRVDDIVNEYCALLDYIQFRSQYFSNIDTSLAPIDVVKPKPVVVQQIAQDVGTLKPRRTRILTDALRARLREAKLTAPKVTCPHCGTEGDKAIMTRWHFDRCKHRPE